VTVKLRAGWRLLLQAMLMVALGLLPILLIAEPLTALHRRGLFLSHLTHDPYDRVINTIIGPLLTIAIVASVYLAARYLDHRSVADFGIVLDRRWWRGLGLGIAVGAIVMAFVFAIELALGWITITSTGVSDAFALAYTTVKVVCVSIYEEVYSRGYLLRNLADGTNMSVAVIVTSLAFALLHLSNPNASLASVLTLFVNGLLFAAALLWTGRLSTAIGVHAAWNFFEGAVFGFPVSGDKEGASLIGIHQGGADWFTGGAFGPEAGVIGIVASLLGIALLRLYTRRSPALTRSRSIR
jgi:membrane protease YdiL (CAAX protease family)